MCRVVAAYSVVRAGLLSQSKKASSVPPVGTDDAAVAVSRVHAPLFAAAHLDADHSGLDLIRAAQAEATAGARRPGRRIPAQRRRQATFGRRGAE